jgi:hypothetical protein
MQQLAPVSPKLFVTLWAYVIKYLEANGKFRNGYQELLTF